MRSGIGERHGVEDHRESMLPPVLTVYARQRGWTLARAHARSGDPIPISSYLGKGDNFDSVVADFSRSYADQNEQDFQAFADAVRIGRLDAVHDGRASG